MLKPLGAREGSARARWRGATACVVRCDWHPRNVRVARFQPQHVSSSPGSDEKALRTPASQRGLNLDRYLVELAKPLKLTLAYDDDSSQVIIHKVARDCQPEAPGILQPGDVLVRVDNLVVDDARWRPRQIGRLVVGLNASVPPVARLIFQRPGSVAGRRPRYMWYAEGCNGEASSGECDHASAPPIILRGAALPPVTPGHVMTVSFHNTAFQRAACIRHLERSQAWRDATLHCIRNKPLLMFRARGVIKDTGVGPQVVRPSKTFASELSPSDRGDGVMANVVPFPTGPSQTGQDDRRTATRTVRAFLPWVLLSIGRLDISDVRHVAVEFGLRNILEISVRLCELRRPCLMAPVPGSSLDRFIECVASVHRHAVGQGLNARSAAAPKGCVVMLHCARNMEVPAATVLAAYLHWHGCVSLQESLQLTQQVCGCQVDTKLLAMATAKLAREAGMRRQVRTITWPYGGNEVTLVAQLPRVGAWGAWPGPLPSRSSSNGDERSVQPRLAPGWSPPASVSGRPSGVVPPLAASAHAENGVHPGTMHFPMQRDESGCHCVRVQVQPQRQPQSLRYCFLSDGVLNVDPAVPHERGPGDSIMNVLRGPQLQRDAASQLRLARREAAMRALQFGWQVAAASKVAEASNRGGSRTRT